jgi:heme exporter protein A
MTEVSLTAVGVHVFRGDRHVLRGLSFDAAAGTCTQVTGPNGAGKTTLLRTLAGLVWPEEGEVRWRGQPIRRDARAFHADLAFLGHDSPLKGDLTSRENLQFAVGIRRRVARDEIEGALARVGARSLADRRVRTLSAGQRRRVALAAVLLIEAPLWLLDEPATNLDADGQRIVNELIAAQLERGGTVVAAVHHDLALPVGRLKPLILAAA